MKKLHNASQRAFHRFMLLGLVTDFEKFSQLNYRERCLISARAWKLEHDVRNKQILSDWQAANRNYVSTYNRVRGPKIRKDCREKLKNEVFNVLGNSCACCGDITREFFNVDHITPIKYRRNAVGDQAFRRVYHDVLSQTDPRAKYRILCFNCNMATRYFHSCPHQSDEVRRFLAICDKLSGVLVK